VVPVTLQALQTLCRHQPEHMAQVAEVPKWTSGTQSGLTEEGGDADGDEGDGPEEIEVDPGAAQDGDA
jgi:hypothetical protein